MELPKRKSLRCKGYDYKTIGYYFVTICVKSKEKILCDIVGDDAHIVPKPYGMVVEKYLRSAAEVEKYVIMPNHIHLLIKLGDGAMWASPPTHSVSTVVRSIKTLVSKEIGKPLFQRSFHDHIIRNERDYANIWNYIEQNPLRWKSDCFFTD